MRAIARNAMLAPPSREPPEMAPQPRVEEYAASRRPHPLHVIQLTTGASCLHVHLNIQTQLNDPQPACVGKLRAANGAATPDFFRRDSNDRSRLARLAIAPILTAMLLSPAALRAQGAAAATTAAPKMSQAKFDLFIVTGIRQQSIVNPMTKLLADQGETNLLTAEQVDSIAALNAAIRT